MGRKRHRPEEIAAKLRQVEVLTTQGHTVAVAIRSIGVTEVLFAILHIALAEMRLKIRGELDAIRRVEIDHLHPASEVFAPTTACHDLEGIAEDHAVRPVHVMLVKLHRLCRHPRPTSSGPWRR